MSRHSPFGVTRPQWAWVGSLWNEICWFSSVFETCWSSSICSCMHASVNRFIVGSAPSHYITNIDLLDIGSAGTYLMKFESKLKTTLSRKCFWKLRLQNIGHFAQGSVSLRWVLFPNLQHPYCPACRTSLIATRFWVVVICPIIKCLTVLEFSFILFDLCLFITIFNFILNYVPIVTFWIFTYHKIWILLIIFCFIWNYWIIYFLTWLEVFWSVVS